MAAMIRPGAPKHEAPRGASFGPSCRTRGERCTLLRTERSCEAIYGPLCCLLAVNANAGDSFKTTFMDAPARPRPGISVVAAWVKASDRITAFVARSLKH